MPNTDAPIIDEWVSHLRKTVGGVDEQTYFIAHSIGCQALMRFLEKVEGKCGKVIFVAGWFRLTNITNEGEEAEAVAKPWLNTPIDFDKVKQKMRSLTVLLSNNDPYGFVKENAETFREKLGAKIRIERNKGHFADKMLPEILEEI